ncbi:hypothetical protein BDR26DRAFT_904505 [Obelidium mucronatum]|nr:hypothetical protein BDR26DRAFT_904505 [Obelidium mucronatum]
MAQEGILHFLLPHETAYIMFKGPKEVHIFTDLAYVSIRGENAISTRRFIDRIEYTESIISNVCFETAGMGLTDRDVELKFQIGGHHISIDIWKNEIEGAKLFYKALLVLSHLQAKNKELLKLSLDALPRFLPGKSEGVASGVTQYGEGIAKEQLDQAAGFSYARTVIATAQYLQSQLIPRSYRDVFEQYLSL